MQYVSVFTAEVSEASELPFMCLSDVQGLHVGTNFL